MAAIYKIWPEFQCCNWALILRFVWFFLTSYSKIAHKIFVIYASVISLLKINYFCPLYQISIVFSDFEALRFDLYTTWLKCNRAKNNTKNTYWNCRKPVIVSVMNCGKKVNYYLSTKWLQLISHINNMRIMWMYTCVCVWDERNRAHLQVSQWMKARIGNYLSDQRGHGNWI